MTPEEEGALKAARDLIAFGVPVFAAPPALDASGEWDPAGGTGKTGYVFPPAWQKTVATENWLDPSAPGWADKAWRPGWALGAVMGHGFDLLDVDPRNGGLETRQALVDDGTWPTSHGLAVTPSGGWHEFIVSIGVASRDDLRPGLDVKAGMPDGQGRGFAFIAPTVKRSKEDGEIRPYRWLAPPSRPPAGDETGAALRELLSATRASKAASGGEGEAGEIGQPIPHGAHDKTMRDYVWKLRHRLPEGDALLLALARGRDCVPATWTDEMTRVMVRRAYEKDVPEWEPPETGPALTLVGAPERIGSAVDLESVAQGETFPVVDWFEAWQAPEAEDWILEPLIAASRGIALYSAPKLGKSLLMLEVAVAVSQGQPAAGMTPPKPRTVLYVDHENDLRADIVRRLRSMGYSPADLGNLRYLNLPVMGALDEPRGGAELLAVAVREGAELVVIDTVSRTIAGEENSNDTWISFYRHTGKALKAAGIACVRLDHSGKDETRGQRGASAKSGDVDAVWQLTRSGDNEFTLYCEAQRMGIAEAQRTLAFRRVDEPRLRHERIKPPTKLEQDAKLLRALWDALEEAGLNIDPLDDDRNPKTGAAIEAELKEAGVKVGRKGIAKSVVTSRWKWLNNYGCPKPDYALDEPGEAPDLGLVAS